MFLSQVNNRSFYTFGLQLKEKLLPQGLFHRLSHSALATTSGIYFSGSFSTVCCRVTARLLAYAQIRDLSFCSVNICFT